MKLIVEAFKSKECADCGLWYPPCVMDFDHIENDKTNNVSTLVKSGGINKLIEEILKCEVVCSNCHRIRTFKRLHNIMVV